MAKLHRISADQYGWETSNFIGSLKQSNSWHQNWSDFYINERLIPQFKLASDQAYISEADRKLFEKFLNKVKDLIRKL